MAIRTKPSRGDTRETFNNRDLEKLDGLIPKRKISPRPKEPPPLPPPKSKACESRQENSCETEITPYKNCVGNDQQPLSPIRKEQIRKKQKITVFKNIEIKTEDTNVCQQTEQQIVSETNVDDAVMKSKVLPKMDNKDAVPFKISSQQQEPQVSDDVETNEPESKSKDEVKENIVTSIPEKRTMKEPAIKTDIKEIREIFENQPVTDKVPQAPPRKRSNNKQPSMNIQIGGEYSKMTVESNNDREKEKRALTENYSVKKSDEFTLSQQNLSIDSNLSVSPFREHLGKKLEKLTLGKESPEIYNTSDETRVIHGNTKIFDWGNNIQNSNKYDNSELISPNKDYINKTVVQITPSSSPVHKIQIKNEFPETANVQTITVSENTQRKTSIMINGDDCYSTVNVSDDIPIYQSSVVVKGYGIDENSSKNNRRSSSVYITGRFDEEQSSKQKFFSDTEEQNYKNQSQNCTCRNSSPTTTKDENEVSINGNDLKTDIKGFEKTERNIEKCVRASTPDMLREILRDPVEAVKRNLVPHICGKSDLQRRPRDLKLKNYYPMISLKESDATCMKENGSRDERIPLRPWHFDSPIEDDKDACSEHSSSTQYEFVDPGSDCYTDHSNRSSVTEEELSNRTKFYELLADSALLEVSENEDHHYECINRNDNDPIYEEIEIPPPLPSNPPPISLLDDLKLDKEFTTR